jgi:hypothetical protein
LAHFTGWAEQQLQDLDVLTDEADSILGILEWGAEAGSWPEVLRLGQAVEGALTLQGWWGAWERVLGWELRAARALEDRAAEGWALHQLGTRALCLEDASAARENLGEALRLREASGDFEGAAVTRHNLRLLDGLYGDHGLRDGGGSEWWRSRLWLGVIALVIALVLLGATALGTEQTDNGIFPSLLPDPLQRLLEGDEPGGPDAPSGGSASPETSPSSPSSSRETASPETSPSSPSSSASASSDP